NALTWQPAQSLGFAIEACVVSVTLVSTATPAGRYPATPRSTYPAAPCGVLDDTVGEPRFRWHFMQRFWSGSGVLIGNRSWWLFVDPCGSWQMEQVWGELIVVESRSW